MERMDNLLTVIDKHKEKIPDGAYVEIMDEMKKLHFLATRPLYEVSVMYPDSTLRYDKDSGCAPVALQSIKEIHFYCTISEKENPSEILSRLIEGSNDYREVSVWQLRAFIDDGGELLAPLFAPKDTTIVTAIEGDEDEDCARLEPVPISFHCNFVWVRTKRL